MGVWTHHIPELWGGQGSRHEFRGCTGTADILQGDGENTTYIQPVAQLAQLWSLVIYISWWNKFYWSLENIYGHGHKPGPPSEWHHLVFCRAKDKAQMRKSKWTVLKEHMDLSNQQRWQTTLLGLITSTAGISEQISRLVGMRIGCCQAG